MEQQNKITFFANACKINTSIVITIPKGICDNLQILKTDQLTLTLENVRKRKNGN